MESIAAKIKVPKPKKTVLKKFCTEISNQVTFFLIATQTAN